MNYKKNILIAEDDQDIMRHLMKGILARRRMLYNTFVCIDGLEALESLRTHRIDCLILDLDMSNLNGIQVLQEMQKNGQLEKTQVIISSGYLDESMINQLKFFGLRYFLRKPYPIEALIEAIDKATLPQELFHG